MRYVIVPKAVLLVSVDGKRWKEIDPDDLAGKTLRDQLPVTTHRYLMIYVVNEMQHEIVDGQPRATPKIGTGYEGNKRIGKLDRSFKNAQPGSIVAVEPEDWKVVKKIIDERIWNPPQYGACLEPIEAAWMDATESKEQAEKLRAIGATPATYDVIAPATTGRDATSPANADHR